MLRSAGFLFSLFFFAFELTASAGAAGVLSINEVMASNRLTIEDPQGHYDDWIELHNSGRVPLDLSGMVLTDDVENPTPWRIPAGTTIGVGAYLLIWADNDVADPGLHAGFELDAAGDQIVLLDTDGLTLLDTVEFGHQTPDVSFGREPDGAETWVTLSPTPGASNDGAFLPVVADTTFTHDRGFYDQPFEVAITTETEGATIRYTTGGSTPTPEYGIVYHQPILIHKTTSLRAMAFQAGWKSTNVDTHTYLFLDDVIGQATNATTGAQVTPEGCPTSWGSANGDYQMDPDVVGQNGADTYDGLYADTIEQDLQAVPTICLVMHKDDWFGSRGIYINQSQDGTERVVSMEYIDPATEQSFQINCAVAMQGGVSGGGTSLGRWKTFKLSMRPRFKPQTDDGEVTGGPGKLDFKVFPDSPVERFNTVVLDGILNHSWLHPSSGQRNTAMYVQDQYVADMHNAMGGHSPHGGYAHVYINTLYWGMYYIHERPDHAWAAQVFGGEEDEYDAIKHNSGGIINSGLGGNARTNYNAMVAAAGAVSSDPGSLAAYQALTQLLDVDNFITYLLANWYTGNHDWPHKNWYATHHNIPEGKWRFHSWDAEHSLEGSNDVGESPSDIHGRLKRNAEYRLHFADLVHRFFFNDGPLTPQAAAEQYRARMDQVDRAIVGESARWGDNRQSRPYTREDWYNTQTSKLASLFPSRTNQVLGWLRNADLYPDLDAPEFFVKGAPLHGGHLDSPDAIALDPIEGTVYYTLDGTDPRIPGTAGPPANEFALLPETASKKVLVPGGAVDDAWRGGGDFDDATWTAGDGGVGYERSSGYDPYFDIDVQDAMYGNNASCYIRIPFEVTPDGLLEANGLDLKVRYDDGFIAYLNGAEVQRSGFDGTPSWNASASGSHSDIDAVNLEVFDISDHIMNLRLGWNILAIHGLNMDTTSSDFLISVALTSTRSAGGGAIASGLSPTAIRYTGPVTLDASAAVKARALSGGTWSALTEATFAVGPVAENLRISEIMYRPAEDPNAEYIELTNIGAEPLNLNRVAFTEGVDFVFDGVTVAPGAYVLVVRDVAAFEAAYGDGLPIAGQYAGSLNNAGERIELQDAVGQTIARFRYQDSWHEVTDGLGFSLTVRDPAATEADALDDKSAWRPSGNAGGSPGFDDTGAVPELGAVVINELMANPSDGDSDWVELYNTTDEAIDLGGWFLSDDADDFTKYEIAEGTTLLPDGYVVFSVDEHFGNDQDPGCHEPFALRRNGETLCLHSGADGLVTGYSAEEEFDASEPGVSLGRYRKSTGAYNFVALSEPTPGQINAEPKVGPIVINEIMYNPLASAEAEYVELLNISDASVMLYDPVLETPWRFTDNPDDPGIELLLPIEPPLVLEPGAYLLLVRDPMAFNAAYTVPAGTPILAWGPGKLANGSEKIQLSKPAGEAGPWIRVDRVVYSDGSNPEDFATGADPWPLEPDGHGAALIRIDPAAYGNDPANWQAALPSPGQPN